VRRPAACALFLCAACAGPVQWEKEGASAAAQEQDTKDCRQQARLRATDVLSTPALPPPGMISAPGLQQEKFALREAQEFHGCMVAKGWQEKR
jgi:hypothetical protein